MAYEFVDDLNYEGLIKGEWDINQCMDFLMLSETSQKRLSGIPASSKHSAVKKIVSRRIEFLIIYKREKLLSPINGYEVSLCNASQVDPLITLIIATLNLRLGIIREAFPSYKTIILPIHSVTSAQELNKQLKIMEEGLLRMIAWHNERIEQERKSKLNSQ